MKPFFRKPGLNFCSFGGDRNKSTDGWIKPLDAGQGRLD